MVSKIRVGILGATGSVGQRFVQMLDGHPWFEVACLTASDRSVGHSYGEACHWVLTDPMPRWAANMTVQPTQPDLDVQVAFSALPADIANEIEPGLAQAGVAVFSNASAFRTAEDVPVLLPEVNADHANLIKVQRKNRGWKGSIVTNPNCTSTGMTVALKALDEAFGVSSVFAVSIQAISGAGYPGVASLDIMDNVIPNVSGEESKVEWEPRKMLGRLEGDAIDLAPLTISAHTNRVAVSDGHIVCLSIDLKQKASQEEASQVLSAYRGPEESRDLPLAPHPVIMVREEADRPQPRLDRNTGGGMTTVVGRLRSGILEDLKMVVLSHNTVRGAAGGSIYNAELLYRQGLIA